jgi:hypothetical protein
MSLDVHYTSFNEFKKNFPLIGKEGKKLQLKGTGRNCKVALYQSNINNKNFSIKIQTKNEQEPIVNERIVSYILHQVLDSKYSKYFAKVHGTFWFTIDIQQQNIYVDKNDFKSPNEGFQDCPGIIISEVENSVSLYQIVKDRTDFVSLLPKLNDFFHCLLNVGKRIGFAHHDIHLGNVLYNKESNHFVLTDLEKSHIPELEHRQQSKIYDFIETEKQAIHHVPNYTKCKPADGMTMELKEKYINSMKLKHANQLMWMNPMDSFFENPYYYRKITKRIPKANHIGKEIYILNDLAELSVLINDYQPVAYKEHISNLNNELAECDTVSEKNKVRVKHFKAFDPLTFTLFLGLFWYEALNNRFNKYKTTSCDESDLFYYKNQVCCSMNRDLFDVIKCKMIAFYETDMRETIRAWLHVKIKYSVGGWDNGDKNADNFVFIDEESDFIEDLSKVNVLLKSNASISDEEFSKSLTEREMALTEMLEENKYPLKQHANVGGSKRTALKKLKYNKISIKK